MPLLNRIYYVLSQLEWVEEEHTVTGGVGAVRGIKESKVVCCCCVVLWPNREDVNKVL